MDETLRQHIIEELSLSQESEETVDEVITTIGGLIMQMVIMKVTKMLSDEDVITFEQILSGDSPNKQEKVTEFLIDHVVGLEEVVTQSSNEVIREYKKLD